MLEHVKLVHKCCPLLKAYIEAQKANRDHEGGAAAADSAQQPQALLLDHSPEHEVVQKYDNLPNVSDTDSKVKLDTLSNDLQKLKLEEEQLRVQQEYVNFLFIRLLNNLCFLFPFFLFCGISVILGNLLALAFRVHVTVCVRQNVTFI